MKEHWNVRHGLTKSPTYRTWRSMKARCYNPQSLSFKYYGAKGIRICERWESFDAFLEDMGERPEGTSIDRLDSTKNYEPENCRWATTKQQNRNLSTNVILEYRGARRCVSEWAEIAGLSKETLGQRLRSGWCIEKALATPARRYKLARLPRGIQNGL